MDLTNRVKETLRGGGTALGVFVPMPSPDVVEICALAGFDFVMLDAEHGRIDAETAYAMILAAEARGVPALARVGENDRQVILKYLDLGIAGVMIPRTDTPAEVEAAVRAMRYHPAGERGLAGGRTFSFGLGEAAKELVPRINERVLAIAQFENAGSVRHLEAMMAIEGLDVLFVGPNDLAQSMGFPGEPGHPEVQATIDRICEICRGGPVALGTVAADAAGVNRQLERGFRMVVTNAPALMIAGARELLGGIAR